MMTKIKLTVDDARDTRRICRDYSEFLASKNKSLAFSSIDAKTDDRLFKFQQRIVEWALKRGRSAIFADTGLGKTIMQVEWSRKVSAHGDVLIVAPLAVAGQTVDIAKDVLTTDITYSRDGSKPSPITITNYEMLDRFDPRDFCGVVLDESSILKNQSGKTRQKIIDMFARTDYRLSCTATPSPNDFMELGSQCEFLGVMTMAEMLAMFFTHDGGETSKWRLKGHAKDKFWEWMATWSIVVRKPHDVGVDGEDKKYDLPQLNYHEHIVNFAHQGFDLFPKIAQTLTEQRQVKRQSLDHRVADCAALVNRTPGPWIVWCHLNDESDALAKSIKGAVQIKGSDDIDHKEKSLMGFSSGDIRVLVTKPSIAGFGLNWQHCANMAFVGMDHSFERFYQAVRRVWRFGQTQEVNVHIFATEHDGGILTNIARKEAQHDELHEMMAGRMRDMVISEIEGKKQQRSDYSVETETGGGWTMHNGDCVDVVSSMDGDSIDYTVFSPPFSSLYTYSNSDRDMGNCSGDDQFAEHFRFLVPELLRVTKPGRLLSFHCMNLPTSKQNHGYIGIRDFRGELIRMFIECGWIFHSEVVIWKDPVIAMQRTKALGLLHKQLKKDACMSRQGIPDYLVTMRKPGENPSPVTNTNKTFPVSEWQKYASPVWTDINPSKTLQYRAARENEDERHICPLQLDVIERALRLWSNEGDLVLSPFAGIGSEGYVSLQMNRRFVGVELKRSYFDLAIKHLSSAHIDQGQIFS